MYLSEESAYPQSTHQIRPIAVGSFIDSIRPIILLFACLTAHAQSTADTAEAHRALAKAAAGADLQGIYDAACPAPPPEGVAARNAGRGAGARGPRPTPPREDWYNEPVKVFDNLYFLGTKVHESWAVTTSDGIIVIDALFGYAAEAEITDGMKKLGLDPSKIRYVIISHGHADHSGGAKYLQDTYHARIILSPADWDLLARDPNNAAINPKRDIEATDGQKLTLGDTTLTLYITPGHTGGTISTLIPVKDHGQNHLAVEWGGTVIGPTSPIEMLQAYVKSAQRFRDLATGGDVVITNHTAFDGTLAKNAALATRNPGDPNPWIVGSATVQRYLTVAEECGKANLMTAEERLGPVAARPLYRDPTFDHPTDPVLTYNPESKRWLMYYTQRRGGGIELIHGTKIGIAASEDNGATWKYIGIADITYGQNQHPTDYTYWAPEVIWATDKYHMYLSYVPGIFKDWNHSREIVHLTSTDGIKWTNVGKVDLGSNKVIDACVIQLPDGQWRMFYKDEEKPMSLSYADSPDLYRWNAKGNAVTDRNGEGPKVIHWQGKYWLIADTWSGQGVWSSEDATHWTRQEGVLIGNHGDVVINGDRAWWFYFGGEYGRNSNIDWAVIPSSAAPSGAPRPRATRGQGEAINVVELKIVNGKLMYTDPGQPVRINLGNQREAEK